MILNELIDLTGRVVGNPIEIVINIEHLKRCLY